jgi:hypothetical protein
MTGLDNDYLEKQMALFHNGSKAIHLVKPIVDGEINATNQRLMYHAEHITGNNTMFCTFQMCSWLNCLCAVFVLHGINRSRKTKG